MQGAVMGASNPADPSAAGTAEAYAAVLTYVLRESFRLDLARTRELRHDLSALVLEAAARSRCEEPNVPPAVVVERSTGLYSAALDTEEPVGTPVPSEAGGAQASLSDWAWLIVDSLENAYQTDKADRVFLHASAHGVLTGHVSGRPSSYLPAAIRQRLAATSSALVPSGHAAENANEGREAVQ